MSTDDNDRIKELISIVIEILKNNLDTFDLYLFGSRNKNRHSLHSDIDLAIESKADIQKIKKVKEEIDGMNTLYSIDFVDLKTVDPDFKRIILNTGKKICSYEKSGNCIFFK